MEKEMVVSEKDNLPITGFGYELSEGEKVSGLLKMSLNRKPKKIFFNGKEYAEFHDLQVISNYFGHSIRTYDAQSVNIDGVAGFKAHADLINKDGIHIGGSEAYCMKDEPNWARKPLFQLASMAQTRAASKCITNVYRWVLDLAGCGTTPAEEMDGMKQETSSMPPSDPKTWPHPADTPPVPQGAKPGKGLTTATITVSDYKDFVSKKGTNFIRIYDIMGAPYMIFDGPLIEYAKSVVGSEVSISFENNKWGNTIKDIIAL